MSDLYSFDFGGGSGLQAPSTWSTPSTSSWSTPDYSFGGGSDVGIQMDFNPTWTPSSGGDWFSGGSNLGVQAGVNNLWTPSSGGDLWNTGGGVGLTPGSGFNVWDSIGGSGGGAWWDFGGGASSRMPGISQWNQPSWSVGSGFGSGVSIGQGQTNYGITSGVGQGPQGGIGINPASISAPGVTSNSAGTTGAFGVDPGVLMNGQGSGLGLRAPSMLEFGPSGAVGAGRGVQGAGEFSTGSGSAGQPAQQDGARTAEGEPAQKGGDKNPIESRLRSVEKWGKENPLTARGAAALAQYLLAQNQSRGANRLAREELNMRREQYRQQMEDRDRMMGQQAADRERAMAMAAAEQRMRQQAMATQMNAMRRNNALADQHNAQSRQSFDEARSLYNPQELGIRGMASTKAATERGISDMRQQMLRRGMSPAAIEAEARRARLSGSTGGVTAYMQGLDTGRAGMQSALGAAKGLSSPYSGVNYGGQNVSIPTVNPGSVGSPGMMDLASLSAANGAGGTAAINDILQWYLGDPSRVETENRRRALQESKK